jgi:uncharacterized RDD family membrane protein YckC
MLESKVGYSPGKGLLDLKVVGANGTRASFWRTLLRHFLDPVDMFYFIGMITIRSTSYPNRLGDFVAGTRVLPDV